MKTSSLLALVLLLLSSCTDCGRWVSHKDGSYGPWWWHSQLASAPPYPPQIADEPCIWTEGGKSLLIDRWGEHELR